MSHDDNILARTKRVQKTIFCEAVNRGSSLKAISIDSGLGYTTIQSYARGEAAMSVTALVKLTGVIDDDLLSLLLPDGRQIVQAPDDIDHDALCDLAQDYVAAKAAAHRHDSPAGVDIAPCEEQTLRTKAVTLKVAS